MHEHGRSAELGEMRSPPLVRLVGRVERIGEQKESVGYLRILGREHGSLAAAIGVSAEEDPAVRENAQFAGRFT
jgi:hypothetical protein